ncbi:MAG: radical SAM protein, partial [Endomicrobiia bacterium]
MQPGYKNITDKKFKQIIDNLYEILSCCELCGHRCKVNRFKNELGFCGASYKLKISSYNLHFGEEKPISGYNGSGTIFFSHCNLRCVFCQNYEISQLAEGIEISEEKLAEVMLELQRQNAHNINFVSPTHFLPQIIKALYLASKSGLNIPVVYNTGGYDNKEVIKILDGIIDIYMPDMKYSDNKFSEIYSKAKDYPEVNKETVK